MFPKLVAWTKIGAVEVVKGGSGLSQVKMGQQDILMGWIGTRRDKKKKKSNGYLRMGTEQLKGWNCH